MTKNDLLAGAERYQKIADKACENYQQTGLPRYETRWRQYEDIAEAHRQAANSADEHAELIALRAGIASALMKEDALRAVRTIAKIHGIG